MLLDVLPDMNISDSFGALSIFCWLFAQLPQCLENYRNKSVESLSAIFLISWAMGDLTNLIGCILTDQLKFQVYLASYFCLIDILLMGQYAYYSRINPPAPLPPLHRGHTRSRSRSRRSKFAEVMRQSQILANKPVSASIRSSSTHLPGVADSQTSTIHPHHTISRPPFHSSDSASLSRARGISKPRPSKSLILFSFWALFGLGMHSYTNTLPSTSISKVWHFNISSNSTLSSTSSFQQTLLIQAKEKRPRLPPKLNLQMIIGRISAWTCATLYLTSRMPQVWKNFRRRSVEGLSLLLFTSALSGNVTYVISILSNPSIKTDPTFLPECVPFLLGSGGTVVFDLTILCQAVIYRKSQLKRKNLHRKTPRRRAYTEGDVEEVVGLLASSSEDEAVKDQRGRMDTKLQESRSLSSSSIESDMKKHAPSERIRSISRGRKRATFDVVSSTKSLDQIPEQATPPSGFASPKPC